MIIRMQSPRTKQWNEREIPVTEEQLAAWRKGALAQQVFPHLSDADREFIMTGYTPEDWEAIFPPDETEAVQGKE